MNSPDPTSESTQSAPEVPAEPPAAPGPRIWVDADACPVKDEIERLAGKRGIEVIHVCCLVAFRRNAPGVRVVHVETNPDAADDYIATRCTDTDAVMTDDVPLARRAVLRGAVALDFRGREWNEETIGARVVVRDLLHTLRNEGHEMGGPAPFSKRHREQFTHALGRILDRLTFAWKQRGAAGGK